jgi:hypothetical protein
MTRKLALDEQNEALAKALPAMRLNEIGQTILDNWEKVYFGARPYLDAILMLDDIKQDFGMDSGKSIVIYFLGNATTWRGEVARLVKKELKSRAGIK